MATKYQTIYQLLGETAKMVSSSDLEWRKYLYTSSWMYKYSFEEQLLIYAQKPDAKACTTFDTWNNKFHRWINKGAKGIALPNGNNRLQYVFDVADTNNTANTPLKLWTYTLDRDEDKEVIRRLEERYGKVDDDYFGYRLKSIARNLVEDNARDYISSLLKYNKNSALEEMNAQDIKKIFTDLVINSITFQIYERIEIIEYGYYYDGWFENITYFNTPETFFQLGQAVSDMSEEFILQVINATKEYLYEKNISTFALPKEIHQNEIVDERSMPNDQDNIQPSGRLSDSQLDSRETSTIRQIRTDADGVSENQTSGILSSIENQERTEQSLVGNTNASQSDVGNNNETEDRVNESRNSQQGNASNGVGTSDEPNQDGSRGSHSSRDNLQLNLDLGDIGGIEDKEKSVPPFDMQDLPTLLRDGHNLSDRITKGDVVKFYNEHANPEQRRKYIREHLFRGSFQTFRQHDPYDYSYIGYFVSSHNENTNSIILYSGNFATRDTSSTVDYDFIQEEIGKLIDKEEYLQSPYEKMTVIQRNYHNGYFNRDVDRIIFSHTDSYTVLPSEIIATLTAIKSKEEKMEYIQTIFLDGITTFTIDEVPLGYEKSDDGLFLFTGEHDNPRASTNYKWDSVLSEIEGLILSRYFAPTVQLPDEEEQRNAVYHSIEEFQKGNYFSQEEIDAVLVRGSGFANGKMRIYDALSKMGNQKDDISFLKNEYGTGGAHPKVGYIGEEHNRKGLTLSKGYISKDDIKYTLPWKYVRNRIKTLISLEQYLSKEEEVQYQSFLLDKMKSSVSNTLPTEKEVLQTINGNIPKEYQYQLNDTVYIGIKEFEIIEIHDKITLQDKNFPLFVEEYSKEEIDPLVKENPLNDSLLRPVEVMDTSVEKTIIVPIESPWHTCYKQSINQLLEEIQNTSYADVLRDREITPEEAMDILNNDLDDFVNDKIDPLFMFLCHINGHLKDVVINELFDKLYNDIVDTTDIFPEIAYMERHFEEDIVINALSAIKIEDIDVDIDDDNQLVAKDEDSIWRNGDFYDFLLNEAIVDHGENTPISNELYNALQYYSNERHKNIVRDIEDIAFQQDEIVETSPTIPKENYRIDNNDFQVGTSKERYQNNVAAIKLLFSLEEENRNATSEEQEILSKYVGWGGLSDVFNDSKSNWSNEYQEVKNLLTDEEYSSARESTLTAFYTSPAVSKAMYQAIENMGFKHGNILEPSCATGNFIGSISDNLLSSKIYGIELDSISGRIAQKLYPNSNIVVDGYENVDVPDSFFDVAIGNIPFGQFKVSDKRYDKLNFSIHDYFFAKTIDKIRPGGVIAFVTSRYTMDKANASVRKYINERTEFLGAIRLPNNAFKDSAGTKVVSDIIFLQKRDRPMVLESEWLYTEQNEHGHGMNTYFINHPEMVLGTLSTTKAMHGRETLDVVPFDDVTLEEILSNAIENIHGEMNVYLVEESIDNEVEIETITADPNVRNFSFTLHDDAIYYRENSIMRKVNTTITAKNRITGLIAIRESVRELIRLQTEDYSNEDIEKEQDKLNDLYDTYITRYGLINSRGNSIAFRDDSSYFLLASLEILNEDGTLKRKTDMFSKRTIRKKEVITSVGTALEALPISLSEKGKVDIAYISSLCNRSNDEVINDLQGMIYKIPNITTENSKEEYVTTDEYLSGNIRDKLEIAELSAKIDAQYQNHVDVLKQSLPTPLPASEISVRIGATWIPESDYRDFLFELFETSSYNQGYIDVTYSDIADKWNIKNKTFDRGNVKAESTYGTNRVNGYKLIEDCLNLKSTKIYDYEYDDEGKKVAILNKKETMIAQQKQDTIKEAFKDWIWKDVDRRERLANKYNQVFNSIRTREFDGGHLQFPDMSPEIELRQHQKDSIARILYSNNVLLAHCVGAGKTFAMVAAAMELKRLGISNKQMFVVPNHLINQWGAEFLQLYPSANILVALERDFKMNNRKRYCSRIATGEYDAIIIGHSMFEKIPMSVERQKQQIENEIETITRGIADIKANNGENFTIKQMERTKKSLKNRLDKLNDDSRKDDVITFEELGVDRIFVDEAHHFKNLFLYTKMSNVSGLSQSEAQKSSDLFMKCCYLDEITNNKGTVFATGTPVSNSMTEMYTMQRYLQYDTLRKMGLINFDSWASTFGETINAIELTPEGKGYRMKTRFAKFYNLPELISIFKEVADIKTADMLKLPVPNAHYHSISVKPSELQKQMVEGLAKRAEKIRDGIVDPSEDNMLKITNDGRKLALDQRLINDMLPEYEDNKVNACIDNVIDIYERTKENRSTQLLFCDMSTPKPGIFNIYDEIRNKLLIYGIPENEVAYIHSAKTNVQKNELFAKVRNGDIRILLGSTSKMGAGTNVQSLLYAIHDLDCPWRPADLEQRAGRIVRQGNSNKDVYIYRYVTEETFDAYSYQLVESKQRFISQIMTSKSPVRSADDVDEAALSYAEIKALASGNPLIKEKMDLDVQVGKLKLEKATYLSQKYDLEDQVLKRYPQEILTLETIINQFTLDINENTLPKKFGGMTIHDIEYREKEQAGSALLLACKSSKGTGETTIGNYCGFILSLEYISFDNAHLLYLENHGKHTVEIANSELGNITRIDNVIKSLPVTLENTKAALEEVQKQLSNAKAEINKPFKKEEELQVKSERLSQLDQQLDIGKGNIIIESEEVKAITNHKREYSR